MESSQTFLQLQESLQSHLQIALLSQKLSWIMESIIESTFVMCRIIAGAVMTCWELGNCSHGLHKQSMVALPCRACQTKLTQPNPGGHCQRWRWSWPQCVIIIVTYGWSRHWKIEMNKHLYLFMSCSWCCSRHSMSTPQLSQMQPFSKRITFIFYPQRYEYYMNALYK